MLDPKLLRESPDAVRAAIAKKHLDVDLDGVLAIDAAWRALLQETEALRAKQKAANTEMAAVKDKKSPEFQAKMAAIKSALDSGVKRVPPAEWPALAEELYNGVVLQVPRQQPRLGKQPSRQSNATSGAGGAPKPTTPSNPFAAFDSGVEEARDAGL